MPRVTLGGVAYMRIIKRWTKKEEKLLKDNYPYSTIQELQKIFPDRSDRSINRKASNMGLTKDESTQRRIGSENSISGYVDKYPYITKDVLVKLYIHDKLSSREVGARLGCSSDVVLNRLRRYDIPVRKHAGDPSFTVEERKEKWGRNGADHPRWKGGITDVSNVIRNRLNHVTLARFKMDGFRCVVCGGGEHNLNAHHIRPFSEIVSEIREEKGLRDLTTWEAKDRLADLCEKDNRLLDLGNLITLCEDCHKKVHAGELTLTIENEKEAAV